MEDSRIGRIMNLGAFTVILFLFIPSRINGLIETGTLRTHENWAFIGRFCFLSDTGELNFQFVYPKKYEVQSILLYFDEPTQWASVYKVPEKTCEDKIGVLREQNNQFIHLDNKHFWSGCTLKNDSVTNVPYYNCTGGRSFRSSRSRWWFIAVSNCNSDKGLSLEYTLHMTNGPEDEVFFREFSADEFYILQTDISFMVVTAAEFFLSIVCANIIQVDIGFMVLYAVFLLLSVYCALLLRNRQLFHTTYKMYMFSLAFEVFHLFFKCLANGIFMNSGFRQDGLKLTGRIFEAISVMTFLLMLILMGKGYTITRGRLSNSGSIKIAVFMTLYIIVFAVLFIYEAEFFDPGLVLYLYESPPGYGLLAMRLIGWLWFCYAIFFTLKHYPEKASFYYPFFIFFTIWFWAGPIVILIAMHVIPLWVREKVVNGVEHVVVFLGHAVFLILTRPSAANSNFPYHVRTSQIGVMTGPAQNGVPDGADMGTDSFSAHPYAPSKMNGNVNEMTNMNGNKNFTDMFCTTRESSSKPVNIDQFPHSQPVQKTNPANHFYAS